jgi:hypothetical protein
MTFLQERIKRVNANFDFFLYISTKHLFLLVYVYEFRLYGLKSLGPTLEAIQDEITSTRTSISFDTCPRRMFVESMPSVFPTSLATDSHGVPTVRFDKSSLPRLTALAIAGGTSGSACKVCNKKLQIIAPLELKLNLLKVPAAMEEHDLLATCVLTCLV